MNKEWSGFHKTKRTWIRKKIKELNRQKSAEFSERLHLQERYTDIFEVKEMQKKILCGLSCTD